MTVSNPVSKMKSMAILVFASFFVVSCSQKQDFMDDNPQLLTEKTSSKKAGNSLGLVSGGIVDNTSLLQSLIDTKATNPLSATGTYLTGQLTVHSYDTIVMQGGFRMLLNPAVTQKPVLYFPSGTHDVYIKGGVLDANWQNNLLGSQLECIKMDEGCYNITIDGVTVNNAKDYGAIQIKGTSSKTCKNINLLNIKSKQTGRTVIECRGVENVVIDQPNLQHWGQQNASSPAIQFQSVDSKNIQILSPSTSGFEGTQFAIESAAANVDNITISNGSFTDNTNAGNNGISGYYTNAKFSYNTMTGGVGSQRSGYEIFGSNNMLDHPVVKNGIIAISTGSVTNKNASNISILYPDVTSTAANNSTLDLGSWGSLVLSNVTVTGGKLNTAGSSGNSSAFTFGYYGCLGTVQNVTMTGTQLWSCTSAVRIQAANGSKNLVMNQVGFMQQTAQVSDITKNVNYTINP